jgi:UDP-hydrolysing UDP-N-acetyl-D-glucosamine 2-epimerase
VRTIGVVTTSRADYGIYTPVLRRIQTQPDLRLRLVVSGTHLLAEHGLTVKRIEADGFPIEARAPLPLTGDTPEAIAGAMGAAVGEFGQLWARFRPDLLVVLGDRFEMHAAALAALPFKIPVAHIHGGELSEGAIDDALRHSLTKLSHLHFVATATYARRIEQLGEEPWRITISGAPSLDNLREVPLWSAAELSARLGLKLDPAPLLVTFHPATLEYEQTEWQVDELLAALEQAGRPVLFTLPNADTSGGVIVKKIREFARTRPRAEVVETLGTQAYFSLMAAAAAMVGNSSSGLVEAPSFKLPVVNIGRRQRGRVRGANVIDVGYRRQEVLEGIRRALSPEMRESLRHSVNPYEQANASEIIVQRLQSVSLDERLLFKQFHDVAFAAQAGGAVP